jgi:hypothetical protein
LSVTVRLSLPAGATPLSACVSVLMGLLFSPRALESPGLYPAHLASYPDTIAVPQAIATSSAEIP